MIRLTRLNGNEFVINSDLIETVEATPDTIVSMTTQQRYVVRETVDEVIDRVAAFRRLSHPLFRLENQRETQLEKPEATPDAASDERED